MTSSVFDCLAVGGRRRPRNFADEAEACREATLVATKFSAGEIQVFMLTDSDRQSYTEASRLLAPLERSTP